ncbi:MAG: Branched-chain-amino-acid aminotransferase [Alphaproteobacteria bacterium MarineAlpha3_Bin1]|nr:MAG: Branched-chain-amino-acid aminotransferase [Alphaproteobacteria bacterium MarineAlpha3_Bin1]
MTNNKSYGTGGIGFIDGEYMPFSELRIPVTDMGFQLADMCYDAVHVWKGRFFRLDDHLARFQTGLQKRRYDTLGYDIEAIADVCNGCVARLGAEDAFVMLIATRGTPMGANKDLRSCQNRLIAWALPFHTIVSDEEMENGCDIVIADTMRIPPEAVDPTVKNFGRMDFVGALFEAYDRKADYAVLLDAEGCVTEGRGWNIFALRQGALLSPDDGVLEGITRKTVLELSADLNVDGRLARITADELRGADEVFLTSTAGGIMPVKSIDKKIVGDGAPGPVTQRLTELYWKLHDDPELTTPVNYQLAEGQATEA